jgi:lactate dehydrogenase-like 2-hydroxyacid dehydrogenase
MGRIGRTIARRVRGFDMNVHYHNRRRLEAQLEEDANYHPTLEGLLAVSDVLILAAPSTPHTKGLLNGARIEELPANAILVNIARGDLIDDDALIGALRSGRIAGAGLDVFNNERAWMPDTLIFPMSSCNRTREVRRWRPGSRWQASCLPESTPSSPVRALQIWSFELPRRGPGQ